MRVSGTNRIRTQGLRDTGQPFGKHSGRHGDCVRAVGREQGLRAASVMPKSMYLAARSIKVWMEAGLLR
jgi:hypothetical protein